MMTLLRTPQVMTGALVVAAMTVTASAQQQSATNSPAATQAQVERYVVGQALPPVTPGTKVVEMTLEEAMARALDKNLDLKAARMTPALVDYQLQSARAAFNPQITGTYSYRDQATVTNNSLEAVSNYNSRNQGFNGGLSQTTPWYGGRLTANFQNSRNASTNPQQTLNPSYNATLSFNYTQPLLAGFKIDNTRNQLRTLAISRQTTDIQLLQTIETTKANVRTAYWNLRQAIEQIEIQKRALELANRLLTENRTKVEIGTLAPIDTVQPESAVAASEQQLLNAEITWKTAEINFKRLIISGTEDELIGTTINPTERPSLTQQTVDIPAAVRTAMDQRTDITIAKKNIESAQLNLEVTKNQTKPQLDLAGGYSVTGQDGARYSNGVLVDPGGYAGALNQVFGLDLPTWNFQFNFTYPLFMAAARANYARAALQVDQQQAQLKATELNITATVTNAGLAVENSYKQVQAAQKSRIAAEANADAEQTRFDVGMSTNYNVVDAQNRLTIARLSELQAIIRHLNAVAEFDRVQRFGG